MCYSGKCKYEDSHYGECIWKWEAEYPPDDALCMEPMDRHLIEEPCLPLEEYIMREGAEEQWV